MKKLFFLLLPMLAAAWLVSLQACRKCKIEGHVLEFGTEKPIPNATVVLSECEGEVLGNFTCFEVARQQAGADGQFAFKESGFSLSAEAADYWPTGDDTKLVFGDCPDPVTVYLYPHATLEVTLKNESGAYAFSSPYFNSSGHEYHLQQGEVLNESYDVKGNTLFTYVFSIFPENGGPPLTNLDSIQVIANGIKILPIRGIAASYFDITPEGHTTTKVTIIY